MPSSTAPWRTGRICRRRPPRFVQQTMLSARPRRRTDLRSDLRGLPRKPAYGPRRTMAWLALPVSRPGPLYWRRMANLGRRREKERVGDRSVETARGSGLDDRAARRSHARSVDRLDRFRTSVRKEQAAEALLDSASTSYSASLDAYQYGVKNLVDVLTAEKQLAQARLSGVCPFTTFSGGSRPGIRNREPAA